VKSADARPAIRIRGPRAWGRVRGPRRSVERGHGSVEREEARAASFCGAAAIRRRPWPERPALTAAPALAATTIRST
jgi:hypothetical protein